MDDPKLKRIIDLSPCANFVPTFCEVYENVIVLKQKRDDQTEEERIVLGRGQFVILMKHLEQEEINEKCCPVCGDVHSKENGMICT